MQTCSKRISPYGWRRREHKLADLPQSVGEGPARSAVGGSGWELASGGLRGCPRQEAPACPAKRRARQASPDQIVVMGSRSSLELSSTVSLTLLRAAASGGEGITSTGRRAWWDTWWETLLSTSEARPRRLRDPSTTSAASTSSASATTAAPTDAGRVRREWLRVEADRAQSRRPRQPATPLRRVPPSRWRRSHR